MPSASAADRRKFRRATSTPGDRAGTLFLIGTPIGNLGDITLRAIETLRSVDRIVAEDTRRTRALLSHLGISGKPLFALDANASAKSVASVIDKIAGGENVAFATDAGMPGVSDPGAQLVREAVVRGVRVTAVPGPSAVTTAVALSGLVDAAYVFFGFLPRSGGKRKHAITKLSATSEPVVLFEAPKRVHDTLTDLARTMPEREAALCRELTKLHEEVVRGSLEELSLSERDYLGEVVLVLGSFETPVAAEPADLDSRIAERLAQGRSTKDIVAELREESGLPKRELYLRVERLKIDV